MYESKEKFYTTPRIKLEKADAKAPNTTRKCYLVSKKEKNQ